MIRYSLCVLSFIAQIFPLLATSQVSHANKPAHYNQTELQSYFTAFEENKGQVCDQYGNTRQDVLFTGIAGGLVYHVCAGGISYQLTWFEESEERPTQTRFSKQVHSNDTFPCKFHSNIKIKY